MSFTPNDDLIRKAQELINALKGGSPAPTHDPDDRFLGPPVSVGKMPSLPAPPGDAIGDQPYITPQDELFPDPFPIPLPLPPQPDDPSGGETVTVPVISIGPGGGTFDRTTSPTPPSPSPGGVVDEEVIIAPVEPASAGLAGNSLLLLLLLGAGGYFILKKDGKKQ